MARILLAFDASDGSLGAVTALSHWSLRGSDLTLLTVRERGVALSSRVLRLRETAARSFRRLGARVSLALADGEPAAQILDYARSMPADLIVLGPRKRPALTQLLLGSVSTEVLRQAVSPVLIGRLSLTAERCLVVIAADEDLAALQLAWPTMPLPPRLEVILAGLPSPIPCMDVPSPMRHVLPQAIPRTVALAEESRLQRLLERGKDFVARMGLPVTSVMLPPRERDVAEVLALEARVAPELVVMRRPSPDDERELVARARSSVLALP